MPNFIRLFVRIRPGMWTCVGDGEFEGPGGRIEVALGTTFTQGTSFMGIDVAELLEAEYIKKDGYDKASQFSPDSPHDPIGPVPPRG